MPTGDAPPADLCGGPAGVPTARKAHKRVGGHAATPQSVLTRSAVVSYTHATQIETPIRGEHALAGTNRHGTESAAVSGRGEKRQGRAPR
jgi:hypothetical protein